MNKLKSGKEYFVMNHSILIKLRENFYEITPRLAMFYNTECWGVQKQFVHKLRVEKMMLLRWISG